MTVLLTRPLADSQRIASDLAAHGIETLIWPLTRIEMTSDPIDVPDGAAALVFSSGHAIRAFCEGSARRDLPVYCVGARTAALAREHGFAQVHAADGNFEALVARVSQARPASALYLRGRDVTGDLAQALKADGIACTEQIVYAAEASGPPDATVNAALSAGEINVITIWSRRNAALLCESISARCDWKTDHIHLIAISQNVVAPLGNLGFRRIIVASRPNATQMIAEIRAALR